MLKPISCHGVLVSTIGRGLARPLVQHGQLRSFGGSFLHVRPPTSDFTPTKANPTKALFTSKPRQQQRYSSSVTAKRDQLSNMAATKEYRLFCLENPLLGKTHCCFQQ